MSADRLSMIQMSSIDDNNYNSPFRLSSYDSSSNNNPMQSRESEIDYGK